MARKKKTIPYGELVENSWDLYHTLCADYDFVESWCEDFKAHATKAQVKALLTAVTPEYGLWPPVHDAEKVLAEVKDGQKVFDLMTTKTGLEPCVIAQVYRALT